MRLTALLSFAVLSIASCAPSSPPVRRAAVGFAIPKLDPPSRTSVDSVVIVTLDGARWQEIFQGPEELMPTLHRWMTLDGVGIGAPGHGEVWSSGPNFVSLPGYTEIFTGRRSRCQSNECGPIDEPTLVDEVQDRGFDAAVVSSWERLARAASRAPSRVTLSTGRHVTGRTDAFAPESLAAGRDGGPWPGSDDYRPDALTMRVALDLVATHLPQVLFVGLGDMDEHAHHGDHARYLESLRAADGFLHELEERLPARTAIFVTADHGRNAAFRDHGGGWHESGRVWLVVKGAGSARGFVDMGIRHLADIAPTVRCLLGMPPDVGEGSGESIELLCPSGDTHE